jgi:hypothetical protein
VAHLRLFPLLAWKLVFPDSLYKRHLVRIYRHRQC